MYVKMLQQDQCDNVTASTESDDLDQQHWVSYEILKFDSFKISSLIIPISFILSNAF